ncbi:MAG: alpha-galactosidase [bacterium]
MNKPSASPATSPADMVKSRNWTGRYFSSPSKLPFSFYKDGKKIYGIPDDWYPTIVKKRIDANIVETVFEGIDSAGLMVQVEMLEYSDFPVVEWTVWLINNSEMDSTIIYDLQGIDASFVGSAPVLLHCNGDFCNETGYTTLETPLIDGKSLTFAPNGGRSCDGAFPYYRVQFADSGLTLAIGWPGQWSAVFDGTGDGVDIKAGQQLTNISLSPGEKIRSPRITMMSWVGDSTRAINIWRRWYMAHIIPRTDGKPLQPLMAVCGTGEGEEFTGATTENQLQYQNKFAALGIDFDVWWIDAGWYPCKDENGDKKWWHTGSWLPDPDRFPNGMKKVSENASKYGARLLVWFEPERVTTGSKLFNGHPEWLLKKENDFNSLLNMGNSDCRQWLTNYVCDLIKKNGIGIYRQDFNFEPLDFWRLNEPENRQGMNENLHIQGYLQYWDDLLVRNPNLWIDSCASGGRRNDLETMRRSVPLHYTDYGYGNHPVKLAFHNTMYSWIPYFKESTSSWHPDRYEYIRYDESLDSFTFHCAMAGMLFVTIDIRRDDYDIELCKKMVPIWRRAAEFLLNGDYYSLTSFTRTDKEWNVVQFDMPETGNGIIQGIRHVFCPEDKCIVNLQGIDAGYEYLLENMETDETLQISGTELINNRFTFSLPPRSGAVWFYKKI